MLRCLFIFIFSVYVLDIVSSFVILDQAGNHLYHREARRRPSMVQQINPEYFDYPSLKDILSDISNKKTADTELRKRQIDRENEAAFALRVNPVIPRNPLSVKNYSKECQERKSWCAEMPSPTPKVCPPSDTLAPIPPTCGPTKPPTTEREYVYCNYEKSDAPVIHDPCEECATTQKRTTEFVACWSMPPPTAFARLRLCNPTTMPCHLIPCTYRKVVPLSSETPPQPPRCDLGSLDAIRNPESKYYILVKRSPGSWRSKRSRPRRRFRIVSETLY